ncbi:MAG TPA: hypothetical protein VN861_18115 [Candidatus Acidoferrales bacterium]|nr:hypothetical protein [Candidatus Acidoferrales bacterium]
MSPVAAGSVITTGLALLAFVIAFYVLLARERKVPYITNFVFPPAGLVIFAILFSFVGQLSQPGSRPQQTPVSLLSRIRGATSTAATWLAIICLAAGIVVTLLDIWRLHSRQVHFRDDHWVKNTRFVRWVKRKWRQGSAEPTYEHVTIDVDAKEVATALRSAGFPDIPQSPSDLRTISICKESLRATDRMLGKLCRELINVGWYVQYTTCVRHPFEFVQVLKSVFDSKWTENAGKVIIVDAYTPHFGFTDSIHEVKSAQLRTEGVQTIPARDSYAGLHTANARAFNILKSLAGANPPRKPALLLYEGTNALSDLESTEQYRIFARHVLTSERMWGGMLTCFVEPTIGTAEAELLRIYSDLILRLPEVQSGQSV